MLGRVSMGVIVLVLPPLLVLGPTEAASGVQAELPGTTSTTTSSSASVTTSGTATTTAARATAPAVCATPARRGFWPTRAKIKDVGRRIPVLAMGRYNRVPLAPPLTSLGKRSFAWDKYGPAPGARRGNVRFNAHTWPDGSALGNKLLKQLQVGDRIILRGDTAALCYTVTKRRKVLPRSYTARVAYYNTTGKPRLAIVVCSGTRYGPGNWSHRTIWFARPSTT